MNEKPEIEVGKLPVITKFIYTLGVLPTSYLMSMTYQEQVTWLYNYLQTQVIPLLNTESAAIQELQTLYELLRTYVNDYFDNLDVQEEINNKLNEMAQDGTLTTLIGNYVQPYINAQDQVIENFKNSVNDQIEVIDTKVTNAVSGSPLVASSTSEMSDTTRVYVNTTDGHWYYYNGSAWTDGGVYQSTEIADNSIDKDKLNNNVIIDNQVTFKNINMNSDTRNRFEIGFLYEANVGDTIDTKMTGDIITNDDSNIALVRCVSYVSTGSNPQKVGGTAVDNVAFWLNQTKKVNYHYNGIPKQDGSSPKYNYIIAIRIETNTFTNIGDISIDNFQLLINDEYKKPDKILYGATNDVATYNHIINLSNKTFTLASKEYVKEQINIIDEKITNQIKYNDIIVNTASELVNAINSIATSKDNNNANFYNRYNIKLNSGTYELNGVVNVSEVSSSHVLFHRGLEIPDFVNLIGIGNVIISYNNNDNNLVDKISTINIYGSNTIKNIKLIGENVRYVIHDDDGGSVKNSESNIINCELIHENNNIGNWSMQSCIGSGYTGGRTTNIINSILETKTNAPALFAHTSTGYYMTDKATLNLESSVFKSNGLNSIELNDPYGSLNQCIVSLKSNYLNKNIKLYNSPNVIQNGKWTLIGGGNSNITITNENNSNVYVA